MAAFALAWIVFVGWAAATFGLLERVAPLRRAPIGGRRIAAAAGLLAVEALLARLIVSSAATPTSVARVVAGFAVAELAHYAIHRAMHRLPILWRFHRLHHRAEPLAWASAWYVHPVDAAFFAVAALSGAAVGGTAPVWFVVGRRAWTVVLHANVAWPWRAPWLDRVLALPAFHHRHHDEARAPVNFASTLPVLDRLFGSANSNGSDRVEGDGALAPPLQVKCIVNKGEAITVLGFEPEYRGIQVESMDRLSSACRTELVNSGLTVADTTVVPSMKS